MTVNKQLRMLWALSILLILVNAALVGWIWLRPGPGPRPGGDRVLIEKLGLDDAQQEKLKQLRDAHFQSMRELMDRRKVAKDNLFDQVKADQMNESLIDSSLRNIGQMEMDRDRATLMHFRAIRDMLKAEQKPKFDALINEMLRPAPGGEHGPGAGRPPH